MLFNLSNPEITLLQMQPCCANMNCSNLQNNISSSSQDPRQAESFHICAWLYCGINENVCVCVFVAVQEERQRGKERGENEVESTSSFNEDMPVDKILDAELAVEPKTETYSDGSPGNSVRITQSELDL